MRDRSPARGSPRSRSTRSTRRAASLRRVAVRLRAPVPADDGEAGRRLDRRPSPAISIDQKTTSRNPRSTVGTVTEIYDYLRCSTRGSRAALPGLRAPDRRAVARPDRGAGAAASEGRSSRSTLRSCAGSQGGVQGRARRAPARRLHAREGRRGAAAARGGDRPRQEKFKHTIEVVVDRLVMKADLRQRLTQSIETATALATGLVVIDVVDGVYDVLREPGVPGSRRLAARARAARLLLQLTARRLPALHGARLPARDRPGPPRSRLVASRSTRALVPWTIGSQSFYDSVIEAVAERYEISLDAPWRDSTRRSRIASSTARVATASSSPTATGWGGSGSTRWRSRGSSRTCSAAKETDLVCSSASGSRST